MKIFNGKKEADKILKKLKKLIKEEKLSPHLAVVLVGSDKPSEIYINLKKEAAEKIGVKFSLYKYDSNANENKIIRKIEELNNTKTVTGIIIQLPLPERFNTLKVLSKISPKKDADGFHSKNLDAIKKRRSLVKPVLPVVLFYILNKAYKGDFNKKKIKAVVNSKIFGNTLKSFFLFKDVGVDVLINKKYSTDKITEFTKDADILISVLGKPNFIKSNMIKEKVILIDAGITKKGKKIYGDFDFESIKNKAKFITPVPGGVGPITIAVLLRNVAEASK